MLSCVSLALNRPQLAVVGLRNEIDASIATPGLGPLTPEPHLAHERPVQGMGLKKPPTDFFEGAPPLDRVSRQAREKLLKTDQSVPRTPHLQRGSQMNATDLAI